MSALWATTPVSRVCDTSWVTEVPSGLMTFLFTDIEGSTQAWDRDESAMSTALARHDYLLRSSFADYGGYVFSTGGDGMGVAFSQAADAAAAAITAQRALASEQWPQS